MQIQSIDKSNVKFKSRKSIERASAFVNMNDDQLKDIAYVMSYDKSSKRNRKSASSSFYAIPIIDVIASGLLVSKSSFGRNFIAKLLKKAPDMTSRALKETLNSASLKTRLKSAGSTAGGWAMALSVIALYNVVKKAIVSKSDDLKKFQRDNPISSFILDVGAVFAGFAVATRGIDKFKKVFPNTISELSAKSDVVLNRLNKTRFSEEILPKLAEGVSVLSKKAPWAVKTGRFALVNATWIMFGIFLLNSGKARMNAHHKIKKNYQKLKDAQLKTAKHLTKKLKSENDTLVQNQRESLVEFQRELLLGLSNQSGGMASLEMNIF